MENEWSRQGALMEMPRWEESVEMERDSCWNGAQEERRKVREAHLHSTLNRV